MPVLAWVVGRVATAVLTTILVSALSFLFIRLLPPEAFGEPSRC